jgi:hypothetical protein
MNLISLYGKVLCLIVEGLILIFSFFKIKSLKLKLIKINQLNILIFLREFFILGQKLIQVLDMYKGIYKFIF